MNPSHVLIIGSALIAAAFAPKAHASDEFPKSFTTAGGRTFWLAPDAVSKQVVGQAIWNSVTGGTAVVQTGEVALANSAKFALTSTRLLTAANVARAAGTMMAGPGGVVTALTLAPALVEWISKDKAENVRIAPTGDSLERREGPKSQEPSDGFQYRLVKDGGVGPWSGDKTSACVSGIAATNEANIGSMMYLNPRVVNSQCVVDMYQWNPQPNGTPYVLNNAQYLESRGGGCPVGSYTMPNGECTTDPSNWLPASMDDIAPYLFPYAMPVDLARQIVMAGINIAAIPSGVTGPAQGPAEPEKKAVEQLQTPPESTETRTLSGNPYGIPANTPTVTGTSSGSTPISTGGSTVNAPTHSTTTSTYNPSSNTTTSTTSTTTDPLRKETTTSTITNITYTTNNATATTTTTTTTNIVNNITNNVINTVTKNEDTPAPDTKSDEGEPSDTPLGDIPKLYERKYPNGLTGIWNEKKAALTATPVFSLAARLMPTISGGQCPTMMVPMQFATWADFGTRDVAPPCEVWGYAKVIVIVSALLLARRLVFGG